MDQHVPRLIPVNRRIVSFIETFVAVGGMTGGAAHATVIAAFLAAFDREVAALALGAVIRESRSLRMISQSGQIRRSFRQRGLSARECTRLQGPQVLHIEPIGIGSNPVGRAFGILGVVVAPTMLVSLKRTERPRGPLDLAGFGHHQAVPLGARMFGVAGTAG